MTAKNSGSRKISILYFSGIILCVVIILIHIFSFEPWKASGVSIGKPRNVDMEKLQRRLIEKKLSDKKAEYFKILE